MSISKIASAARLIFGILVHKACVGRFCFQTGLYWRGLVHDLSKFHPVEFRFLPDSGLRLEETWRSR